MNTSIHPIGARLALFTLAATALLTSASSSRAAAILSFSGGNNTPFVLTLSAPVQYVINAAPTSSGPFFLFQSVGNVLGAQTGATGTISYSINAGPAVSILTENSGVSAGAIAPSDLYIFGAASTLTIGSVVTLSAGTLTTTSNVASAPPASGSFNTFIVDGNGVQISAAGITVPEPTTWAMLGVGFTALLGFRRRADRAALRQS